MGNHFSNPSSFPSSSKTTNGSSTIITDTIGYGDELEDIDLFGLNEGFGSVGAGVEKQQETDIFNNDDVEGAQHFQKSVFFDDVFNYKINDVDVDKNIGPSPKFRKKIRAAKMA